MALNEKVSQMIPYGPLYNFERFNFWAYVDERDAAQAMEKGISAEYEGSHALFINAVDNSLNYDSLALARLFFPEIANDQLQLKGREALVSIASARELIGYEPAYSIIGVND